MPLVKQDSVPLLVQLKNLQNRTQLGDLTLQDIFLTLGAEGHYVLIFFLILPFLQPVPMLGLSTPFGLLIAIVAWYAFLNKIPWIPQKWQNRKVPTNTIQQIVAGAEKVLNKLSVIFKTRYPQLFRGPFKALNTTVIIVNAILLALPIPVPFSNAIPAWGILFQALANIEDDGILVILSYAQGVFCFFYFFALVKGAETIFSGIWPTV